MFFGTGFTPILQRAVDSLSGATVLGFISLFKRYLNAFWRLFFYFRSFRVFSSFFIELIGNYDVLALDGNFVMTEFKRDFFIDSKVSS
jgi:hypothetical protein